MSDHADSVFDMEMRENPKAIREAMDQLRRDERAASLERLRAAKESAWDECAKLPSRPRLEDNPYRHDESFAARLSRLSMEAMESQGRTAWHQIEPELIEMFNRYQCKACKSWISYSEETGKWRHL